VTLDRVGVFHDGVAVRRVGEETFRLAQRHADEIVTVTTDETCAAIQDTFEDTRAIVLPGAEPRTGRGAADPSRYPPVGAQPGGHPARAARCGASPAGSTYLLTEVRWIHDSVVHWAVIQAPHVVQPPRIRCSAATFLPRGDVYKARDTGK